MSDRRKIIKTKRLYISQKRRGVHFDKFWPHYCVDVDFSKGIGRIEGIRFITTTEIEANGGESE